jgi:hypothetical protein
MPVCLDPLFAYRKVARPKPGPALYALRALAVALAENSAPPAGWSATKSSIPSAIDVGFAVEAEDGVLVPVIRNADQKPLKDLIAPYNELVELARERKLPPTPPAVPSPPSPISAPSAWNGPRRFRCRNRRSCWAWAPRGTNRSWDSVKGQFVPIMEANLT